MVTRTKARVRDELNGVAPKNVRMTFLGDFNANLKRMLDRVTRVQFPSDKYRQDPQRFFEEILGVAVWYKQAEVIEAIEKYPRVAVKSGHKVSKSHTIGGCSLWAYCSFEDAKVVLTSTTSRQVDDILWHEIRKLYARSGRCIVCKLVDPDGRRIPAPCPHSAIIQERPADLARTGMKSEDFRSINGFTAREAEAVAGISGKNLKYFIDESSGVGAPIFEAIEGNRAGGATVALFGNPTRNEGEFYDAFHTKKDLYHCITISSESTPNVQERRVVIPGLAEYDWIKEKKIEWGATSSLYKVRVEGEFAEREEGKIFSVHAISQAELRHADTLPEGMLYVGLDPAGASGQGDESGFAARRGLKHLTTIVRVGLSEEAHLSTLLGFLKDHRQADEIPVVVIDREGQVGAKVYGYLKAHAELHPRDFVLIGVRTSEYAVRDPLIYGRIRDEVIASFESWLRQGGAILADTKLAAEMHAFEWKTDMRGKLRATDKPTLKKLLGRSPDRFDALCLSVWEPTVLVTSAGLPLAGGYTQEQNSDFIDPYGGMDAWRG